MSVTDFEYLQSKLIIIEVENTGSKWSHIPS